MILACLAGSFLIAIGWAAAVWPPTTTGKSAHQAALAGVDGRRLASLERALGELAGTDATLHVVHFWDPGCPCNRAAIEHLYGAVLSRRTSVDRIVVVVPHRQARDEAGRRFRGLQPYGLQIVVADGDLAPPASPLAAVYRSGEGVAYLGPYSNAAGCRPSSGDPVTNTLRAVAAGGRPQYLNLIDPACFCTWPRRP